MDAKQLIIISASRVAVASCRLLLFLSNNAILLSSAIGVTLWYVAAERLMGIGMVAGEAYAACSRIAF